MMKRNLLAGMVGACIFAPVMAQSNVTLYGTVDSGVALSNNGVASAQSVASGVMVPSRFGLRGVEDLGGGLKAKFILEAGFDADTGAAKTTGNPSTATPAAPGGLPVVGLFNRRSIVGLEGGFGSITFGRDYTPLYWSLLQTDVQQLGLLGNLQEVILLSGTGSETFGRASNAAFYETPKLGGFLGRAMYSLGSESAGDGPGAIPPKSANRMFGVQAQYQIGTLLVSGGYQALKIPAVAGNPALFTGSTGTRQDTSISLKYTFGNFAIGTGFMLIRKPTPNSNASDIWLGGSAKIGVGSVILQGQRLRQNVATGPAKTGTVLSASYVHPLSVRTALYASYGQVNNSATSTFAVVTADGAFGPGAAGATAKALALGVRHNF